MTWLSWLLLLCGLTLSTGVELRNVTEPFVVTFEVGQHYQHPLPTLFSMYQATFVSLMQHPNRELYQNPCWPKEVAPSAFKHDAAQAFHYQNRKPVLQRNKTITTFKELLAARTVIDSLMIKNKLLILFQDKQYRMYEVKLNGTIVEVVRDKLTTGKDVLFGNFINMEDTFVFVSPSFLISFDKDQAIEEQLTDVGDYFEEARAVSNKRIVVAAGDKGAYIYNYDISSKKVTFVKNFSLTDDSSNNLDIDDIIFDDDHNLVYVLDKQEGIYSFSIQEISKNTTKISTNPAILQISDCTNLQQSKQKVFVVCDRLIQYDKETKNFESTPQLYFNPKQLLFNESRVFLFGPRQYAMFDSYGNRVQAGFREDITDFTFVYEDRFVTVNDDQVSIDYVTPSVEVLDCYTDSNEIAGLSKGAMEIEGICGQYKEGNINYQGNCIFRYQLHVVVTDSQNRSIALQVILGLSLGLIAIGLVFYFVLKRCKIERQYGNLMESNFIGKGSTTGQGREGILSIEVIK